MCDDDKCECRYCKGDNYDRYIGDHLRECLDNINYCLEEEIDLNDPRCKNDEEIFYNAICRTAMGELTDAKEWVPKKETWCEWFKNIWDCPNTRKTLAKLEQQETLIKDLRAQIKSD